MGFSLLNNRGLKFLPGVERLEYIPKKIWPDIRGIAGSWIIMDYAGQTGRTTAWLQ